MEPNDYCCHRLGRTLGASAAGQCVQRPRCECESCCTNVGLPFGRCRLRVEYSAILSVLEEIVVRTDDSCFSSHARVRFPPQYGDTSVIPSKRVNPAKQPRTVYYQPYPLAVQLLSLDAAFGPQKVRRHAFQTRMQPISALERDRILARLSCIPRSALQALTINAGQDWAVDSAKPVM
jgi:hypothetical protein